MDSNINDITCSRQSILKLLEEITDPEIPVLTITDLGILREVNFDESLFAPEGGWEIIITPTYSGCPAMDVISMTIRQTLEKSGIQNFVIKQKLSPVWTTDWMTKEGKEKLKSYGIAPPVGKALNKDHLENLKVECPLCHSTNTHLLSEFGSTACKALFQCNDCKEPFDYFKCH